MTKIIKIIFGGSKTKSIVVLGIYIILMVVVAYIFSQYVNQDTLQTIVKNTGHLGILIYFFIEVIYVTFTPLLNTLVLIVSGYIFGGSLGFMINFLATTIGLLLIVFLVKKYGRPLVQKIIPPDFYKHFDEIVQKVGPITLLIVYVLPFTPDDELTYIIAAGPIGFKRFIIPIVLGTIAKAAYSYIGALGTAGVAIAVYFRIAMLIIGLIAVGLQEYIIKKRSRLMLSE